MTRQRTRFPAELIAGLAAVLLLLLAGPHSLSAQGDRDPSTPVDVRIGVAVIEYLETRYGTRASQPDGVAISGLASLEPSGERVAFAPADASHVARLTDRPLLTGRWMCGANPSVQLTWTVVIEERSDGEAVVEAVQAASTDQRHGSVFHRLRLERHDSAWGVAEVLSTFSTHGDCRAPG
jgi:hypothetical protein